MHRKISAAPSPSIVIKLHSSLKYLLNQARFNHSLPSHICVRKLYLMKKNYSSSSAQEIWPFCGAPVCHWARCPVTKSAFGVVGADIARGRAKNCGWVQAGSGRTDGRRCCGGNPSRLTVRLRACVLSIDDVDDERHLTSRASTPLSRSGPRFIQSDVFRRAPGLHAAEDRPSLFQSLPPQKQQLACSPSKTHLAVLHSQMGATKQPATASLPKRFSPNILS